MKPNNRIQLMSEAKVSKALFKLGIPMVISMLVTALYNVVDMYFVSELGTQQAGAVSVAFPISLIFSGIGLTFGAGAGSYISRLLGKKEKETADSVASTALFTGVFVGIILSILIFIFLEPILNFMGATETILPYAKKYAIIFVISTLFSTFNVTSGNLAVAQGAANVSLIAMITGAVLNMLLDPLFIYAFHLGVRGAAIATLISQIVTSIIYLCFFSGKRSYIKISLSFFRPSGTLYGEILKIGISMLLLQLLSSLSISLISNAASKYGDEAVAAMGFVLRIITLGVNVVFGYMKGFQPLAGYNYGAKNFSRLNKAIRSCLLCSTVFCILWSIIIFIFQEPILRIFSEDAKVLSIAKDALVANTILFFTFGFQFTYSTLYLAMGKALPGGFLSICRQGIFFLPVILVLPIIFRLNGVIYAQAVADAITTIATIFFAIHIHKQLRDNANISKEG